MLINGWSFSDGVSGVVWCVRERGKEMGDNLRGRDASLTPLKRGRGLASELAMRGVYSSAPPEYIGSVLRQRPEKPEVIFHQGSPHFAIEAFWFRTFHALPRFQLSRSSGVNLAKEDPF